LLHPSHLIDGYFIFYSGFWPVLILSAIVFSSVAASSYNLTVKTFTEKNQNVTQITDDFLILMNVNGIKEFVKIQ